MINQINWQKVNNLIPCIVQDSETKDVLMLGYMNPEALNQTLETELVTFFSRSKNRLWTKGEQSGHTLSLKSIELDCDQDTILIKAKPAGPTCHKGSTTCFRETESQDFGFLGTLSTIIDQRFLDKPQGSYVTSLIEKGLHKMAQKVGEEGVEVALAAKDDDQGEFVGEAADLIFHLMVLLKAKNVSLSEVTEVLKERHQS